MQRILCIAVLTLFVGTCICYSQDDGCVETDVFTETGDNLPVFILAPPDLNPTTIGKLSETLFTERGVQTKRTKDLIVMKSGSKVLEISTRSGGYWFADKSQLWNPDLIPKIPKTEDAKIMAAGLFNLLYAESIRMTSNSATSFSSTGKTLTSRYVIKTKETTDKQLDVQVDYATKVMPFAGKKLSLPVVGGGGEFKFTFGGTQGKLIGQSGVWRNITGVEKLHKVISKQEADEQFRKLMGDMKLESVESYLAYYSAPAFEEQKFLYPVYVYHSSANIRGEIVRLKIVTLPATDFGPELPKMVAVTTKRVENTSPTTMEQRCQNFAPDLPRSRSTDPEGNDNTNGFREVGISWVQDSRLINSGSNAEGFLKEMTAAGTGWTENFNWGDVNAWDCDWVVDDDDWVDAADFVFYAGHADFEKWLLQSPSNGNVRAKYVSPPEDSQGDLWGDEDLEWIIINACGPLEDDRLNHSRGIGRAVDRWASAFDGLHQLLGYGSVVFAIGTEGQKVAQRVLSGETIIDAWFQTAQDVQPPCNRETHPADGPKIWAGVLYAEKNGVESPRQDHIWGKGTVAPDPKPADVIIAIWTTT